MELKIGNKYNVKVSKIIKVGIIVELDDGSTQLIHVSNISNKYVSNIEDFVTVGNTYEATCQEGKINATELTLRPLNLEAKRSNFNHKERNNVFNEHKDERKQHSHDNCSTTQDNDDLDSMIASMNKDYEDKIRSRRKDRYNNKKKYKNRREDY